MDKILLIDSSEAAAAFIMRCLTKNGFDVIHVTTMIGVSSRIKFANVGIIIIDSDINGESGYDVCRKLKNAADSAFVPTLLMGESETGSALTKALAAGADDFVTRRFDEATLVSKVKALLRIKRLSDELKEQYKELEKKNNTLDEQLNMAMRVQRSLIREYDIGFNGIRLASRYNPAMQIGGDFYDIIRLDDENVSVVMGDVSGHGISAALLTAMLNMMIRSLAPKHYNPARFLYYMNEEFNRVFENAGNNQMYACVFYAVINTRVKCVSYSNAGQSPPVFVNSGAGVAYELEIGGNPIGMMAEPKYEHKIALYDEGDSILFFTDGLTDNMHKDNPDEFYARLKRLLLESSAEPEPSKVFSELMETFYADDGNNYEKDDVSMVLCKM